MTTTRGPQPRNPLGLTERQWTVLRLWAEHYTPAEIGAALGITPGTAKNILQRIHEHLGTEQGRTRSVARLVGIYEAGGIEAVRRLCPQWAWGETRWRL